MRNYTRRAGRVHAVEPVHRQGRRGADAAARRRPAAGHHARVSVRGRRRRGIPVREAVAARRRPVRRGRSVPDQHDARGRADRAGGRSADRRRHARPDHAARCSRLSPEGAGADRPQAAVRSLRPLSIQVFAAVVQDFIRFARLAESARCRQTSSLDGRTSMSTSGQSTLARQRTSRVVGLRNAARFGSAMRIATAEDRDRRRWTSQRAVRTVAVEERQEAARRRRPSTFSP